MKTSNIGYTPEQVQTIKVGYAQSLAKEVIEEINQAIASNMYTYNHDKGMMAAISLIKQKFGIA